MTKDEALKLALEALEVANSCVDGYYIPKGKTHLSEIELAIIAIKEALVNEALDKMAENARELGLDYEPEQTEHGWTPERIAGMAKLKEAQDKKLAQPEQDVGIIRYADISVGKIIHNSPLTQRIWVGLTPACPQGLTEYACEVEGVNLVCFLEYTPDEEGSRDSRGLLDEPGTYENMELVNAYVKGTDVDIGHLLLQYLVDHITTTALEDLKNDDL